MGETTIIRDELPDGVTTKTVYVARDGSEHSRIDFAVEKNATIARVQAANNLLQSGASVWEAARIWSWMDDYSPPDILRKITKNTPLIVSHWQCRDNPEYMVCAFEGDGYYIYVGGNAGSWSGAYGNKMSILDLARYAEDTLRKHPELAAPDALPEVRHG